jgi:glycosyltransferase involved in cell wall biosynthesis
LPDPYATELSVIIPFYEEAPFLRTALNSVYSQPIGPVQVIVVNDNPDRFAPDDLRDLCGRDDVDLIQHPRNLGLSAARNSGLDVARGRYVAFLDADDYYLLGGLARQLDHARQTGADIAHAQTCFTRAGDSRPLLLPRDGALFGTCKTAPGLTAVEEAQFIVSSWSSLYRRDFLDANGLRFDVAQPRFEDRLFVLHSITRAGRIAFLGQPTRVWRGRAGSISVSKTTAATRLLQVQLLEKCLAHTRAEVACDRLPSRFEKRELFNTVSRLIWDMDAIDVIAQGDEPDPDDLARRIPALLGDDSFGQAIFDDTVLARISRVGMATRKGRISRTDFFAIHKSLREGDFAAAQGRIAACRDTPAPAPVPATPRRQGRRQPVLGARRLVLHLGLHKTGTTYLQHHLMGHRDRLLKAGILVPMTGFVPPDPHLRDGATPGHQGLVAALRTGDPAPWAELNREIAASGAATVVLSCENMLFPTLPGREALLNALANRLEGIRQIRPIALVRRADTRIEAFYRERVAGGIRTGTGGLAAFLVDHLEPLADFPGLFGPLESALGVPVQLADFDALRGRALWPGFAVLAGLPADLPVLDVPAYSGPDRDTVRLLDTVNALVLDPQRREALVRAWFGMHPARGADHSLLPPADRLRILDLWDAMSADFAATRGYAPDLTAARATLAAEGWVPPGPLSAHLLSDLVDAAAQFAPLESTPAPVTGRRGGRPPTTGDTVLTVRLRPWAARLWHRVRHRRG